MKNAILIFAAAACAVFSACASTESAETVPESADSAEAVQTVSDVPEQPEAETAAEPEPESDVVDNDNLFTAGGPVRIGADGKAVIHGVINELPFFVWLVSNDSPRLYRYSFTWTDKDGQTQETEKQTRRITPGTGVRFSMPVPPGTEKAVFHIEYAE